LTRSGRASQPSLWESLAQLYRRFTDWLESFDAEDVNRRVDAWYSKWKASDWAYVIGEMPGLDALTFMALLEREEYFAKRQVNIDSSDGDNLVEKTME
jgi:hypothetical protein